MTSVDRSGGVAAVVPASAAEAAAFNEHLRGRGLADAGRFASRSMDDLNKAVCSGAIDRAIFPDVETFLRGIWEGDIEYERWQERGIELEFAAPAPRGFDEVIGSLYGSWRASQRSRRTRSTVAGVILGVVALAAGFMLILGPLLAR